MTTNGTEFLPSGSIILRVREEYHFAELDGTGTHGKKNMLKINNGQKTQK